MVKVNVDPGPALDFAGKDSFPALLKETEEKRQMLLARNGKGNDFLGWLDLPDQSGQELLERLKEDGRRLAATSRLLVVVGIGGSYLGARAVIDALAHPFQSLTSSGKPLVVYAGHHLGEDYHAGLLEILDVTDYSVVVISKSGTTTEPAVAFRLIKAHLERKYGKKDAAKRIIAVTDAARGALKQMAVNEGYSTYVIPDDVGGRFSVLTPVGLLPVAAAGFDIGKILSGAGEMQQHCFHSPDNPANTYAAIRNALYRKGKTVEILVNYQPNLQYLTEWWKQLYGESEGKEGKGIFPAGVNFTSDLHSMGQYIQEGQRTMFETVLSVGTPRKLLTVPSEENDLDGLNFLAGRRISDINRMAELGTLLAHADGGVPNIRINLPAIDEEVIGQLIFFFEFACALSGYVLDVNPFDQPGVEAYKKNMFALLGKPGFEKQGDELKKRLGISN